MGIIDHYFPSHMTERISHRALLQLDEVYGGDIANEYPALRMYMVNTGPHNRPGVEGAKLDAFLLQLMNLETAVRPLHSADYQTPLEALRKLATEYPDRQEIQKLWEATQSELANHLTQGEDAASAFMTEQLARARTLMGWKNIA
ncbi:MAG: hypothetical protein Greene101449_1116 [Candidatus Peregrinibacteria bacterium Greene1014_49]|nr:MAG: hypothetical protein Greene101449_1116 [Candidatus Peregrinibacteria bacterium Greene1014_49]